MNCVVCGEKPAHIQLESQCPSCYSATHPLLAQITPEKTLQLPFCETCSRLKIGRKWYRIDDSFAIDYLKPELFRTMRLPKDVEILIQRKIIEFSKTNIPRVLHVQITAKKRILPSIFQQEIREIPIKLDIQLCTHCSQLKKAHYEALLQIRADNRGFTQEEAQWITTQVNDRITKAFEKDPRNYLSKLDERPEGLDFYFSTVSSALQIARYLASYTAARLQISYKLVSADPSLKHPKKRATISLRVPNYRRGDFVTFQPKQAKRSEIIQILSFSQGTVHFYSFKNASKVSIPVKLFNEYQPSVITPAQTLHSFIIITTHDDSVHLMDLQSYQMYEISKEQFRTNIKPGNVINATVIDDKLYISFYHAEDIATCRSNNDGTIDSLANNEQKGEI
ncbi:MAG: NMD3-related protein [Candidatus Heimdallarchaeota archaeon]